MSRCDTCITDKSKCINCSENPKYPKHSQYAAYIPVCPRGYTDCIGDPAYIKYKYPDWYKSLYGDLSPEEAIKIEDGCLDKVKEDPDEKYYCYDDEDK